MPAFILRLVVLAYSWERFISMEGLVAQPLWPSRGVTAGDWAATYMLKAYMVKLLRRQQARHPGITISVPAGSSTAPVTSVVRK